MIRCDKTVFYLGIEIKIKICYDNNVFGGFL